MPNTLRTKNIAREPCFSFSSSVLGGFVSFSSSVIAVVVIITVVAAVVLFPVLLLPLLTLEFENDHNKSV